MRQLKNAIIVKVIAIVVFTAVVWTIGYLSGLEIGQKRTEQNFSQQNQNQKDQNGALLPQIPEAAGNNSAGQNNVLPQIPTIK